MTRTRRKLPIGIQTFAKIREDDCYYVDKTGFALRLIEQGTHYFLSRPRRFGRTPMPGGAFSRSSVDHGAHPEDWTTHCPRSLELDFSMTAG